MCSFEDKLTSWLGEKNSQIAGARPLTKEEQDLNDRVFRPLVKNAPIDPQQSFLDGKAAYDKSELLRILQRMPKGGILHTHSIATADFRTCVQKFRANPMCYVWKGGDKENLPNGTVKAFVPDAMRDEGWVLASEVDEEELYNYWTMPSGLKDVESCWKVFLTIWDRIMPMNLCVPVYFGKNGLLWSMLKRMVQNNVFYIEIKEGICFKYTEYDGTELTDEEFVCRFRDTVEEFKAEHPVFIGAKIVLVSLKFFPIENVEDHFARSIVLKKTFPDLIAGFDLAGPEDTVHPNSFYAPMFEKHRAKAAAEGVELPLLLHAGETNIPGASQVVEAVALGCKRIGHGFGLSRYPTLIQKVKDLGISLECCPISNQVLGYTGNMATHPALGLLRSGVQVHLSPDDPGPWRYDDVSYDFTAVAKAWDLGLLEIRALARNSLVCSTLDDQTKKKAVSHFDKHWEAWIKSEIERASSTLKDAGLA